MSVLEAVLRGLLIVAGLLLPGAGWAIARRWPLPWFAAGVVSVLAIFTGLVGLVALGLPVTLGTMAAWLGVVGCGGGVFWWTRRRPPPVVRSRELFEWWLVLPVVPLLAVAAWRAVTQPLPGVDADFRWDHLARLIVQSGRMDFYPPVSPEAFAQYFWADGIAPLVSGLYAWTYLAAGSTAKGWTAIPVLLQVAGLLALLHALARLWQPEARAGWLACALGGGTMLLQFSFNLGQETGLTALGAGAMTLYLVHWQRGGEIPLLVPAAACAGLAACAREYGLLFAGAGVVWVGLQQRGWRSLVLFAGLAAALPLTWHLRVWHLTGNPLYAHDVAGLFPVNPVFDAWMKGYVGTYGSVFAQTEGWREIGRLVMLTCLPAAGGLAAGLLLWRRQAGSFGWGLVALMAAVAWVLSVPFTAGGLFYSMRVLSPLLVLGCAWGGAALARWVPRRKNLSGLLLGLGLFGVDAALRALTIPLNPYATPPAEWPRAGLTYQDEFAREDEPFVKAVTQQVTGRVLSDSAGLQYLFQQAGRTLVPLWSPDVRFLFAAGFQGEAVTRLRKQGYSHFLLKRAQSSVDFLARTGVLKKTEGHMEPVMANDRYILFVLRPPAGADQPRP